MFKITEEMKRIIEEILHTPYSFSVIARAGSGKTRLMIHLAALAGRKYRRKLMVFYNKKLKDELKRKLGDYGIGDEVYDLLRKDYSTNYLKINTIHALGYGLCEETLGKLNINEHKYSTYFYEHLPEMLILNGYSTIANKSWILSYKDRIFNLLHLCRYNLALTLEEIGEVAKKHDITINHNEIFVVSALMDWGMDNTNQIDLDDLVWLPVVLNMTPKYKFDLILVDESQDLSKCEQSVLMKFGTDRGGRYILFGDDCQAINGWKGGDAQALKNFGETLAKRDGLDEVRTFPLSRSWRCPRKITELARQYGVPDIVSDENNPIEGNIEYDVPLSDVKPGSLVLARENKPLYVAYIYLTNIGIDCKIQGVEATERLLEVIKSYNESPDMELNPDITKDGFFRKRYIEIDKMIDEQAAKLNIDRNSAMECDDIVAAYNNIYCLEIFASGCKTVKDLTEKIKSIKCQDENKENNDKNYVLLSTIHKMKGGENNNVYILCGSSLGKSLKTKTDFQEQEEKNIAYVAVTRSRENLYFCDESIVSSSLMLNNKTIIDKLETMLSVIIDRKNETDDIVRDIMTETNGIITSATINPIIERKQKTGAQKMRKFLK